MIESKITALSAYVPDQVISNKWFEDKIETQDEWIVSRTGIRERRFAADNEFTSDLCIEAIKNLLNENPEIDLQEVDFIIVATTTADQVMPSMASQVQYHFDIPGCGCIDVMAACAGFVYGVILAKGLIASGTHRKIIVLGAETLSKFTDYKDRSSCILFGDAAGVALIEVADRPGLLKGVNGTDGSHGKDLYLSQNAQHIDSNAVVANGKIHQNGKVVYKWAVQNMSQKILELLKINNMQTENLDWIILHSANLRIIEAVASAISYPMEQMLTSIEHFGNTSSASIPLAWDIAAKSGKVKKGDKALLLGFGGGLTYAGIIVEV
ncbi:MULTISPECIES: beta-ketoacyl-ACP synthase 3 [unclassified Mucilaginibacter]|uniref:beta-ketoacyl-ACP synthase 3 n=1 Tax=unclassified Mucilaginibacter TaxID=2617802 RepID=UPI002AC96070|nr:MULTISPECIES: beta-ketoacyl-ACP synthase 3 [unclassified Mucilaginibacter]MEB0280537.1 beta-ketoacyl-ACP synthase 3 [Mucilaginibacter sp. 10B2]MEB0301123.1 beta-ketoacyl-ACP synthase 3 [Mucilaginibacter sp. 5C4]WPX22432.1 beta-ketoacyl-ACP synthase 3 [Mucilaginibacter sp. 5C4]